MAQDVVESRQAGAELKNLGIDVPKLTERVRLRLSQLSEGSSVSFLAQEAVEEMLDFLSHDSEFSDLPL